MEFDIRKAKIEHFKSTTFESLAIKSRVLNYIYIPFQAAILQIGLTLIELF